MFSGSWLDSNIGHNLSRYFGQKHELNLPKMFDARTPKVDLIDTDNEVIVKAELAVFNDKYLISTGRQVSTLC